MFTLSLTYQRSNCSKSLFKKDMNLSEPEIESPDWQWSPCDIDILKKINMAQDVEINQYKISSQEVKLTLSKAFMYDQKLAWNWHKGWNLPMIRLHINVTLKSYN